MKRPYLHGLRGLVRSANVWLDEWVEADELEKLRSELGYTVNWNGKEASLIAPEGRRAVFIGDLVDRRRLLVHLGETAFPTRGGIEALPFRDVLEAVQDAATP